MKNDRFHKWTPSPRTISFIVLMLICYLVFSLLEPAYLKSPYSVLLGAVLPAVLALSMGVVISAGGFDLSIGHTAGFATLMCGFFLRDVGLHAYAAILCSIGLTMLIGAVNGIITARFGISSFITTLSMQFVLVGVRQLISSGNSYRANNAIRNIAQGNFLGISNLIIISLFIIAITGFIMQKTTFGRKMQFVGANISASAFSGIRIRVYTFLAFFISGFIAGLAGILQFSKLTTATINIGDGWLFNAMTIAVFSSVIFGRFKAHGIILVAILVNMMTTGINMLGVSSAWTNFVLGFILLLSLAAGKYINFDNLRSIIKITRRKQNGRKETV
ncbi:MAG: ABC transporter permease [Treponema sp.]|jgi:ribose/xylose/arabinose/galactoside ABC-type transport system permease subunit|nr:ABC transporter permease [Treponema sp.]